MTDQQLIRNAQDASVYGRFVDVGAAFNKGLMAATKGRPESTRDVVGAVKNNYENKLNSYLDALPADTDITSIPDKYKNTIHEFLQTQKHNYVVLGRQLASQQVGSDKYMDLQAQMTNIKNSFTNLNNNMSNYGEMKDKLFDDIKTNKTSLSIENQANVNLLSSVFSEEFDMVIDEYGNPTFVGDDGELPMSKLPGYELKAVGAAKSMLGMVDSFYSSGVVLEPGHPIYENKKAELGLLIEQGGRNTLMSIISDGLVGNVKMIQDPLVAQSVTDYNNGAIGFSDLKDVVVNNYMDALSEVSKQGYKAKQTRIARSRTGRGSGYGGRDYKSPITEYSPTYGEKVIIQMPYDLAKNPVRIMSLTGEKLEGFDDIQEETATSSQQSNQPFPARVSTQDGSNADLYTKWGGSLTKKSTAPTVDTPGQNEIQEMIQHLKKINPGQSAEYYKKQAKKSLGL